jgi:hypothetical protein
LAGRRSVWAAGQAGRQASGDPPSPSPPNPPIAGATCAACCWGHTHPTPPSLAHRAASSLPPGPGRAGGARPGRKAAGARPASSYTTPCRPCEQEEGRKEGFFNVVTDNPNRLNQPTAHDQHQPSLYERACDVRSPAPPVGPASSVGKGWGVRLEVAGGVSRAVPPRAPVRRAEG